MTFQGTFLISEHVSKNKMEATIKFPRKTDRHNGVYIQGGLQKISWNWPQSANTYSCW